MSKLTKIQSDPNYNKLLEYHLRERKKTHFVMDRQTDKMNYRNLDKVASDKVAPDKVASDKVASGQSSLGTFT